MADAHTGRPESHSALVAGFRIASFCGCDTRRVRSQDVDCFYRRAHRRGRSVGGCHRAARSTYRKRRKDTERDRCREGGSLSQCAYRLRFRRRLVSISCQRERYRDCRGVHTRHAPCSEGIDPRNEGAPINCPRISPAEISWGNCNVHNLVVACFKPAFKIFAT